MDEYKPLILVESKPLLLLDWICTVGSHRSDWNCWDVWLYLDRSMMLRRIHIVRWVQRDLSHKTNRLIFFLSPMSEMNKAHCRLLFDALLLVLLRLNVYDSKMNCFESVNHGSTLIGLEQGRRGRNKRFSSKTRVTENSFNSIDPPVEWLDPLAHWHARLRRGQG